ncbi:MAG: asparagine synthase (glutamine-hydrolyzing) [Verrucomicrobiota bacterium]
MCGIAGFFDASRNRDADECEEIVQRMVSTLAHRGPDDEGTWADAEAGVALGHRRLAILDLSDEGHQPMHSADGRYVLTFNGEIYNFQELRRELEDRGHRFRGHSDTEAMLAAFSEWGLLPSLERFAGMFAFALWDRHARTLSLVRDRAGEKPLYYGWAGNTLLFGSELKALRVHPAWRGNVHRGALALLVRQGYIPSPHCIYEDHYKLPPGCVLTVTEAQIRSRQTTQPQPYWSPEALAEAGAARPFDGDEMEARGRLNALLRQSVARQMIADVPVGAFLSGGIDSSLVVAAMQEQSARPVRTFSIGFHQDGFDEAPFAKGVARHLGTDHTELYVEDKELLEAVPKLASIYDEPLADSSQIPTLLLCGLAASRVKVSLSGDAGDELFGGYDHYRKTQRVWRVFARVPETLRRRLAQRLKAFSNAGLDLGVTVGLARGTLNRLTNLSDLLSAPTDRALYRVVMSSNRDASAWLVDAREAATRFDAHSPWDNLPELLQRMSWLDLVSFLPDDILVKVDRAAMSVSLETRIPLLDHRIIEFALSLPTRFRQRGGQGKWLLRQLLHQYVPRALVDRPKRGFAAPVAHWLRGPLRAWAEHLLDETRLRREGFFEARTIQKRWREHLSQRRDWSPALWYVLTFQAWLDEQQVVPPQVEPPVAIAARPVTEVEVCPR